MIHNAYYNITATNVSNGTLLGLTWQKLIKLPA